MAKAKKPSDKELIELGKKLQMIYETGYANKKQAILFSFYKGMAGGFGALLGGTILVGLLLWILSFFDQISFVNHFIHMINQSINTK